MRCFALNASSATFCSEEPLSDELFELVTLSAATGGLGLPNLKVHMTRKFIF